LARKILLADDSVTAQNMGRKILADAGYEVITVNNGSAALKKIAEVKPDLIVLDVYMPGYSGLEVCQRVKEGGDTSRIPILLTVGKLEPFKPEEAKRVHAEGFIVKPFEASELLSALAKLEDKMVPRSESSKPGRFARAIAAVEEGRYDKSVAMDEDSGWKNRISFPSKKKRPPEPEDGDDPAIYNALNKDLRTVVDHHRAPVAHEARATATKVDLGALAPEGLPKDVTAEEIAALAAAAAQIQGKIAEAKPVDGKPADLHPVEPPVAERSPEQTAAASHAEPELPKIEAETATQAQGHFELQAAIVASTATDSEPRAKENETAPEMLAGTDAETAQEVASLAVPPPADMMAAISSLETAAASIEPTMGSGNGSSADGSAPQLEVEPVTMAVAAEAERATVAARWTAISVAITTEEAVRDLEEEMHKAHADLAVVEAPPVEAVAFVPEIQPALAEPAATAEIPSAVEPEQQVSTAVFAEPEAEQTSSVVPSTEPEVIHAVVKEFETVTVSSVAAPDTAPAEPEPAPPQALDSATPPAFDAPPEEAKTEEIPVVQVTETEPAVAEPVAASTQHEEPQYEETTPTKQSEPVEEQKSEEPAFAAPVESAAKIEESPVIDEKPETAEPVAASQVPADHAPAEEVAVPADTTHGGIRDMAKKESDIAATTAAAWASWRRIRETGDPKDVARSKSEGEEKAESPGEEAAMAVAAGAEKAPEDASATSDSPEIASIVDSVLADLRPKIVAEISRKLKKKK